MNTAQKPNQAKQPVYEPRGYGVVRDYTESIAMAIILAFLFRMFLLEAFVIPTGSMAPTLHGTHMDVTCPQCEYQYQTGASDENPNQGGHIEVIETNCPLCRYPLRLDKAQFPNQQSFMGDRILVNKFNYSVSEPRRWQVIVFKFPGNAKQNYIKRLVGLPGEQIMIKGGDIYVVPPDEADKTRFRIVRKPPRTLLAMLQLVHDTNYVAKDLQRVGWPSRWQVWAPPGELIEGVWTTAVNEKGYHTSGKNKQDCFLRYHHFVPSSSDWEVISNPADERKREPYRQSIKDYYAYNDGKTYNYNVRPDQHHNPERTRSSGFSWVGDLAAEYEVEVKGSTGQLLLDLVEGGEHFLCSIDVSNGLATLSRRRLTGEKGFFTGPTGTIEENPVGKTKITGPGSYRLRFSNVDNELLLWVNNRLISFQGPTTYESEEWLTEQELPGDPGDYAPLGIGTRSLAMQVKRLRVLRDVYYTAHKSQEQKITVGPDEFLPLGDNSPGSSDGRMWPYPETQQAVPWTSQIEYWDNNQDGRVSAEELPGSMHWMLDQWDTNKDGFIEETETGLKHTVHRRLLIGQATFVYWPHSWRWGKLPLIPNFKQMRLIK
jgi:signal peptidase I